MSTAPADTYAYCTTNFCIRNEAESLFAYEDGHAFSDYDHCDEPFVGVDLNDCSADGVEICGANSACLLDCAVGGFDAAVLNVMDQVDSASEASSSSLRFVPAAIPVSETTEVEISLELVSLVPDLVGFNVYIIPPGSTEPGELVTFLSTSGTLFAGELIYSNTTSLTPAVGDEVYSFQVVPLIAHSEERDSPLVQTAWNAVQSFTSAVLRLSSAPSISAAPTSSAMPSITPTPVPTPTNVSDQLHSASPSSFFVL